ncbi:CAAX prenyl protease-like protein [Mumia flava]|uniref:CAAX prenyl protease-like protein n=1 Tax=Mumia flava TaxID=1348852 RepID=A0A2M9BH87_9ACTN|nr:type II CAAX endopeptidase family protein [Mumia flava]PJJ57299.1 CAAX prenyl protease-like protein [Mumia flava]
MTETGDRADRRRRLGWAGLIVLILGWFLLPQIVGLFVFDLDDMDDGYATVRSTIASDLGMDVGGILILALVVWRLGWWRLVWYEARRVRPWVAVVPVSLLVYCVLVTDYGQLAEVPGSLVVVFGLAMVSTAVSEELLFRGVALQTMRDRYREGWAVFWSCFLFGAIHLVNAVVVGGAALGQVLIAFVSGYLLYLCLRVGRGLWLPIVVHAAIDFAQFSSGVGYAEPPLSDALAYEALLLLVLGGVLLAGRRRISPRGPADPTAVAGADEISPG